jgi:hypothetical protein
MTGLFVRSKYLVEGFINFGFSFSQRPKSMLWSWLDASTKDYFFELRLSLLPMPLNTTIVSICRGSWQWFVEAVLPAAPTTPSLQIKGL